jgi:hypothetical protein
MLRLFLAAVTAAQKCQDVTVAPEGSLGSRRGIEVGSRIGPSSMFRLTVESISGVDLQRAPKMRRQPIAGPELQKVESPQQVRCRS